MMMFELGRLHLSQSDIGAAYEAVASRAKANADGGYVTIVCEDNQAFLTNTN